MIANASDVCYGYESSEEVSNFNSASNSASAARSASFPRVPTPGLPTLAKEEASRHASPRDDGIFKSPSPARSHQPRVGGVNHLESVHELREHLSGMTAVLREKDNVIAVLEKQHGETLLELETKCNENDRLAAAHEGVQHELAAARQECNSYTSVIQQKCFESEQLRKDRDTLKAENEALVKKLEESRVQLKESASPHREEEQPLVKKDKKREEASLLCCTIM